MPALESALLALGPWGIAAVVAMYTFRAMARAIQKRTDTVKSLLEERTREVAELKNERKKLQDENARLEEALDIEREKRRSAEDERARFERELIRRDSYSGAGSPHQANYSVGSRDTGGYLPRGGSPAPAFPESDRRS